MSQAIPSETAQPCCRRGGRRGRGGGAGSVEPAALAALLVADGYGYDIKKTIEELTDGQIAVDIGGLYRVLRRLEDEGSVISRWHEDTSGPARREYELTEQGILLAQQWLEALRRRERCSKVLGDLLEKGLNEGASSNSTVSLQTEGS